MEDRIRQSLLLDFYGELLTERQRSCYELHVNEDLSLSEIAEQCGISRQGVWDNIRRAEQALLEIEEKTGLIRRFEENRAALDKLCESAQALALRVEGSARPLAEALFSELRRLRDKEL
ncbi:MAG: YlxM family DNA-binding protein [Oscillospiraceae bacterium]|nr:YlxM family DNA-binding protein [Oscillospiraceae bacterium]